MGKPLKPVTDLKRKTPHVCATCKHAQNDQGAWYCDRDNGPSWDVGDMWHWLHVCSLWTRDDYNTPCE
jgi:hypothetical protein